MFVKNAKHNQENLFGFQNTLPKKQLQLLEKSQEYKFYEIIFCNINEEDYLVLYSDTDSRPNAPVNTLVSSLILMQRYSWTYEELFKNINFNLLTKTALGLKELDDIPFCEATIFNFQNRLSSYQATTGINLLEKTFDQLTAKQLKQLKLKTNIQRTDSLLAASNIRNYSRVQLLVEVLIRLNRVLKAIDKEYFQQELQSYVSKTSERYIYDLKFKELPRQIEKLGDLYYRLYEQLKGRYSEEEEFRIFERVYKEHFKMEEKEIKVKDSKELTSSLLQSPDDIEATYRNKNGKKSKGQTINVTETANPDNGLNLLTDVSVVPNNIDDSKILNERIETIKEKTPEIDELHFDGGYGSQGNDIKFEQLDITPVQTAVRGREPKVKITIEQTEKNKYSVSCPKQKVKSRLGRKRYKAEFSIPICSGCPLKNQCPTIKKKKTIVYYFNRAEYLKQKRLNSIEKIPSERRKLRNNVEATVSEFKRKMHNGKLKVRGQFKASVFAYTMAVSINFGRIYRYIGSLDRKMAQSGSILVQNVKKSFSLVIKTCYNIFINSLMPKPILY